MPDARGKTRLAMPRDVARKKVIERIEKAAEIGADGVRSETDLASAEEREKRWRQFNSDLLSRLFTTDEYAHEYDQAKRSVHVVSDRYNDPRLIQLKGRLVNSVTSQISALRSIVERLDLIDEGEMPRGTDGAARAEHNVLLLIDRFHLVAQQMRMRHDSRPTLEINDEYDVQDLFHAQLTIYFNDIRKEEWTPSYAGGASRIDYLLLEFEMTIEVKKSRPALTARALGEELIVDIAKYQKHPNCRILVCFVYDPNGIIANPRGVENDLTKQHDQFAVRVMIVPRLHP